MVPALLRLPGEPVRDGDQPNGSVWLLTFDGVMHSDTDRCTPAYQCDACNERDIARVLG